MIAHALELAIAIGGFGTVLLAVLPPQFRDSLLAKIKPKD